MKTVFSWIKIHGVNLLLFAVLLGLVLYTLPSIVESNRAEQLRMTELSLRRSVASCYALEGQYPPNVEYLRENYGLQLNEEKYVVHYEIFAENIMPEITVLERD